MIARKLSGLRFRRNFGQLPPQLCKFQSGGFVRAESIGQNRVSMTMHMVSVNVGSTTLWASKSAVYTAVDTTSCVIIMRERTVAYLRGRPAEATSAHCETAGSNLCTSPCSDEGVTGTLRCPSRAIERHLLPRLPSICLLPTQIRGFIWTAGAYRGAAAVQLLALVGGGGRGGRCLAVGQWQRCR